MPQDFELVLVGTFGRYDKYKHKIDSLIKKYGIEFGEMFQNISGTKFTIITLLIGFIIILMFKNSIEKLYVLKANYKTAIFVAFLLYYSLISMISKKSEFLYFNF